MSTIAEMIKKKKFKEARKPVHVNIKREVAEDFKAVCRQNKIDMSVALEGILVHEIEQFKSQKNL